MEQAILDNTYHLYRSHLVTTILYLVLVVVIIFVGAGVCKFKLVKSVKGRVIIIAMVAVCSMGLILIQLVNIFPVYKDYKKQTYKVVENATVTIKKGATGDIFQFNHVVVMTNGSKINLKIPTDRKLSTEIEYTGTIAYLEHSGYLIWYCFD